MTNKLADQLLRHEDFKSKPYRDTAGKLTIGIGRDLDDVGITLEEARALLANDIERAARALDDKIPWWRHLDDVRQDVLANMCFNMGIHRLVKFEEMLAACSRGAYGVAADEMLDSLWAKQVGARANELAGQMRMGQ